MLIIKKIKVKGEADRKLPDWKNEQPETKERR
jgi:hypothetical protein